MQEFVNVKDLPDPVKAALDGLGYGRKDIGVEVSETVILGGQAGGDGYRCFTVLVNLTTGAHETHWGSWGGANMFNRDNAVDLDDRPYTLPSDGVAVTGHRGGGRPVYATLHIPASMRARVLPAAPTEDLPREVLAALYAHRSYRSGEPRREAMHRFGVRAEHLDVCVSRGLLTRNRAGATQITTAGKNLAARFNEYA